MAKDSLFLLRAGFVNPKGKGSCHCPECASVEGVLSFHPYLRTELEVRYLDIPRPREPLATLLGPDLQGCPVLVLPEGASSSGPGIDTAPNGRSYLAGPAAIIAYLARTYGASAVCA